MIYDDVLKREGGQLLHKRDQMELISQSEEANKGYEVELYV